MYKNILQSIDNVAIWPIISLSIFFIFFLVLLWWVFTADKTFIRKMKNLPFDKSNEPSDQSTTTIHDL
jgi:cytochrome c oxidase cbb3-type subunit 4